MTNNATVIFLDVGQGHCTMVADEDARLALLIDCPVGMAIVVDERLKEHRATLETAIASHLDLDHLGGMLELVELNPPRHLGYNHERPLPEDLAQRAKLTAILRGLAALEDRGIILSNAMAGDSGEIGSIAWEVLAPSKGELTAAYAARKPNRASSLVRVKTRDAAFLLPGDADAVAWQAILDRVSADLLRADVFLVPHHGARLQDGEGQATLVRVLDAVDATYHIVSVGFHNGYGHPHPDVLEELRRRAVAGRRLMCTQINDICLGGAATASVRDAGRGLPISSDGAGLRGNGCACAGSIVFASAVSGNSISPSANDHGRVIASLLSPRCVA